MGRVTRITKITAIPRPKAVLTFFDTARNEHIPKKYAKTMLSMKIDLTNRFKYSIAMCLYYFSSMSSFW